MFCPALSHRLQSFFKDGRVFRGSPQKVLNRQQIVAKSSKSSMKELAPTTYTFAEYELDLARRLLLRAGQSIPLNAKAFDLLVVLIENRERVIAKEELMELVWRDQFVEEANLTVQISALRRILGEKKGEHRFIVTVPGRGYRFVTDVQNGGAKPDSVPDMVIRTHT